MRFIDYKQMTSYSLRYHGMLQRLASFHEHPYLITMRLRKTRKGKVWTQFRVYVRDKKGHERVERLTAYNETFLWVLSALNADFPNCDFQDLTAPELQQYKRTEGEHIEKGNYNGI